MPNIVDISEIILLAGLSNSITEAEYATLESCLRSATAAVIRHLGYDPTLQEWTEYYPQTDLRSGANQQIWDVSDTHAFLRTISEFTSNELQVKQIPVRSISSLKIDYDGRAGTRVGSFGSDTEKVLGTDYWPNFDGTDSDGESICLDGIIRSEGLWPDRPGCVKIVYTAGYSPAELSGTDAKVDASPIATAVKDETSRRILMVQSRVSRASAGFSGPFTSETLGDYSYSGDSATTGKLIDSMRDIMPATAQMLSDFVRMDCGVL